MSSFELVPRIKTVDQMIRFIGHESFMSDRCECKVRKLVRALEHHQIPLFAKALKKNTKLPYILVPVNLIGYQAARDIAAFLENNPVLENVEIKSDGKPHPLKQGYIFRFILRGLSRNKNGKPKRLRFDDIKLHFRRIKFGNLLQELAAYEGLSSLQCSGWYSSGCIRFGLELAARSKYVEHFSLWNCLQKSASDERKETALIRNVLKSSISIKSMFGFPHTFAQHDYCWRGGYQ